VRALVRTNALNPASPAFHVLAMTRDAESSSARKLALLPNVTVVVGDLDHLEPLFVKIATYGKLDAVFSVQTVSSGEERQGKALVDAALKAGVHHFIYSSVDIGTFDVNETVGVPHFDSKRRVELHLRASGLPYTYESICSVASNADIYMSISPESSVQSRLWTTSSTQTSPASSARSYAIKSDPPSRSR